MDSPGHQHCAISICAVLVAQGIHAMGFSSFSHFKSANFQIAKVTQRYHWICARFLWKCEPKFFSPQKLDVYMYLNFVYDVQKYAIIANLCLLSCISKPYSAKNLTTYLFECLLCKYFHFFHMIRYSKSDKIQMPKKKQI